jgi:hypothetical protein
MKILVRHWVKDGMGERLLEFVWRKKCKDDLWNSFMAVLCDIHYDLD